MLPPAVTPLDRTLAEPEPGCETMSPSAAAPACVEPECEAAAAVPVVRGEVVALRRVAPGGEMLVQLGSHAHGNASHVRTAHVRMRCANSPRPRILIVDRLDGTSYCTRLVVPSLVSSVPSLDSWYWGGFRVWFS